MAAIEPPVAGAPVLLAWDMAGEEIPAVATMARRQVADLVALESALDRPAPIVAVMRVPPATPAAIALVAAARQRRTDVRAIVVTEPGDAVTRLGALALGFDEALPSAATPEELAGRIAILGDRVVSSSRPTLPVAPGLELDPIARSLRRRGRLVHLRPMEYRLLEELARHPGIPLSREEILRSVWGTSDLDGSRTIDVHVRWLRAKIERDPRRPVHLVTIRGTGYQLEPNGATDT